MGDQNDSAKTSSRSTSKNMYFVCTAGVAISRYVNRKERMVLHDTSPSLPYYAMPYHTIIYWCTCPPVYTVGYTEASYQTNNTPLSPPPSSCSSCSCCYCCAGFEKHHIRRSSFDDGPSAGSVRGLDACLDHRLGARHQIGVGGALIRSICS